MGILLKIIVIIIIINSSINIHVDSHDANEEGVRNAFTKRPLMCAVMTQSDVFM